MTNIEKVAQYFRWRYGVDLADLEISDVPGYWRDRDARMHPGHPLHTFMFCGGPFKATYTYTDPPRERGRWASPHRTWRAIYEQGRAAP